MSERGAGIAEKTSIRFSRGTHRAVGPAETLRRVRGLHRTLGITRIANITGLDCIGVPVAQAVRPNARTNAVFQGKGATLDAAKASAVMESIEVWHAERAVPDRVAAEAELRADGLEVVAVEDLPRVAGSCYRATHRIGWSEGRDLVSGRSRWVPHELVHADFTLPARPGEGHFAAGTNGLASGNVLLEAIDHALCELIERDARALWSLLDDRRLVARGVDPASIADESCRAVLARFEAARMRVRIWESTSDVGIPCYRCLLMGPEDDPADPEVGDGCHPDAAVALHRALTEAAQARCAMISGARDEVFEHYDLDARAQRRASGEALAALHAPRRAMPPAAAPGTLEQGHARIVEGLRAAGFDEIVIVDLARPALGVPVVRAIVPGLEGIQHARFAPGRRARAARARP